MVKNTGNKKKSPPKATNDPLTGVYTRAILSERLHEELARAVRGGTSFALVMLDIDHFKSVNDAYGHPRGDEVLVEFARRALATVRAGDMVFRYGGDEFVFLLPATDGALARLVAERVLEAVRATPFASETPLNITASAGVAVYPADGENDATLVEAVDRRTYLAKQGGRDCVVVEDTPVAVVAASGPVRLIERDQAFSALHKFLGEMERRERGLLLLLGAEGTGRSRFLDETERAAARRQFGVLSIRGDVARRHRAYGALAAARADWPSLPLPYEGVERFAEALDSTAQERSYCCVVITLDDLDEIDDATLRFVHDLFASAHAPRLALAYPLGVDDRHLNLPREVPQRVQVRLAPLSVAGLRAWARHSLQWEMPEDLLNWLHCETGGLPARITRGLRYLMDQRVIAPNTGNGWVYRTDYADIPLRDHLARPHVEPLRNMPPNLSAFIGREEEIERLKLRVQVAPLVTVLAPGGMGKTRLAIQAAAESYRLFPDGCFFVALASLESASLLVLAIFDALDLPMHGPADPEERLLDYLHDKHLLLVLDNFEHLRSEGEQLLSRILERAPGVRMLVTSRDRLSMGAEVFEVGGLAYPEDEMTAHIETWTAPRLFLQRARDAFPEFALHKEETPFVARICRMVEGMPLGLELAAGWVRTLSCEEIAQRIQQNVRFLTTSHPEIPERHRHLLAVVDSFWNLISETERVTISRLSVFRGGFNRDAAQQVAQASPFFLDALVAKGWLGWEPQARRYSIHELLRQYAAQQERTHTYVLYDASQIHADHYLQLVSTHSMMLHRSFDALRRLRIDLDNIRAAWEWTVRRHNIPAMARSIEGMSRVYTLLGLWQEGRVFEQAFRELHNVTQVRATTTGARVVLGRLLVAWGQFLGRQGRLEELDHVAQRVSALARDTGSVLLETWGVFLGGYTAWRQGTLEKARELLLHAQDVSLELELEELSGIESDLLHRLGDVHFDLGEYEQAKRYLEEARALCADDDIYREARVLNVLGLVAREEGDQATALEYHQRALAIQTELGNQPEQAVQLGNMGAILMQQGHHRAADEHLGRALRIYRACGDRWNSSVALENLGQNAMQQGDLDGAQAYLERSVAVAREIGKQEQFALVYLGLVAHYRGDHAAASELSQQAIDQARASRHPAMQAEALVCQGYALMGLEQPEQAVEACRQAVERYRGAGQEARALEPLAMQAYEPLAQADAAGALYVVEQVWEQLEAGVVPQSLEPLRVELICAQVFQQAHDPRAAEVIQRAGQQLRQRLAQVGADEQGAMLENIPSYREIARLCGLLFGRSAS